MKAKIREFNYSLYFSNHTFKEEDLNIYAEVFGKKIVQNLFKIWVGRYNPILFVPKFDLKIDEWPPKPKSEDFSKSNVSIELIYEYDFVVVQNDLLAGEIKTISSTEKKEIIKNNDEVNYSTDESYVFFISEKEFDLFKKEATEIAQLNKGEEQNIKGELISETRTNDLEKKMKLPDFIKRKILPYFNNSSLNDIARIKNEKGEIIKSSPKTSK